MSFKVLKFIFLILNLSEKEGGWGKEGEREGIKWTLPSIGSLPKYPQLKPLAKGEQRLEIQSRSPSGWQ